MSKYDDVKKDTAKAASELYEQGKENVSSAYEKVKDETQHFAKEVKDKAENVYNSACDHSDQLIEKVKEKPFTSVLIAAGIGYLISSIMNK